MSSVSKLRKEGNDKYPYYVLGLPAPMGRALVEAGLLGAVFAVELTEEGILFRQVGPPDTGQVDLPGVGQERRQAVSAEWMAWRPEHFRGKAKADPRKRVPPALEARDLAVAAALDEADADRIHAEAVEAAARIMAAFGERTGR